MTLSLSAGPADLGALDTPLLVIALPSGGGVDESVSLVDAGLGGAIARSVGRRDFRGGRDETLHIVGGTSGPARVLLLGIGTPSDRVAALRRAGAIAARQAARMGTGSLAMYAGAVTAGRSVALRSPARGFSPRTPRRSSAALDQEVRLPRVMRLRGVFR